MANNSQESEQWLSYQDFCDEIQSKLKELSKKQIATFARRCALHALPYLYQKGDMGFWPEDKRQKHAYAIFNVFDIYRTMVRKKMVLINQLYLV